MKSSSLPDTAVISADQSALGLPSRVLFAVFTLSGISALFYQLIWQRSLLKIYGSNIESVTMVVSAFMLGLGLGSLGGGWVSKKPGVPLLLIFSFVELGIGIYGAFSLWIFDSVGSLTASVSMVTTGALAFTLILVPTLLMGSTLPLLVAHYVAATKSVGYSVGMLYFVNTLGAGIGAFLAAFFCLRVFGMSGSIVFAVALNVLAGCVILRYALAQRGGAA